jgi:hypothetical protein
MTTVSNARIAKAMRGRDLSSEVSISEFLSLERWGMLIIPDPVEGVARSVLIGGAAIVGIRGGSMVEASGDGAMFAGDIFCDVN